jgi:histidinol-phosphatase
VTDWTAELRFAEELADTADQISMRHFRQAETAIRAKADGTPVTEADEAIEKILRKEIASSYPDHGILGEEEGSTGEDAPAKWIIDPIDGTKNYSWGIPIWGTLIALEVDGEIVCGVASAPALGDRFTAARGGGAHRNGETMSVSGIGELAQARLGFTSARTGGPFGDGFEKLLRMAAHDRGFGDFYGHMLVACGSLDLMIEPNLAPWDIAPLIVIIEEAGGRLTDFEGKPHIYGRTCLTTNGLLHAEALRVIAAA